VMRHGSRRADQGYLLRIQFEFTSTHDSFIIGPAAWCSGTSARFLVRSIFLESVVTFGA
jgi:hypothetical protein